MSWSIRSICAEIGAFGSTPGMEKKGGRRSGLSSLDIAIFSMSKMKKLNENKDFVVSKPHVCIRTRRVDDLRN